MSEPKRYERCYHKDYIPEGMEEHYNGKWVSWEDYARLKAQVERLTKQTQWQPIETAPFQPRVRIIVDRNDDGEVGIVYSTDLSYYSIEQYPDWWMPLPSAPAKGVQS